jgi:hypothetical protein
MLNAKLLATIVLGLLIAVALAALVWWRNSVDTKLGYCKTPTDTCVNRQGAAVGEPCECHGMGGGVFGLDSTGIVIPPNSN